MSLHVYIVQSAERAGLSREENVSTPRSAKMTAPPHRLVGSLSASLFANRSWVVKRCSLHWSSLMTTLALRPRGESFQRLEIAPPCPLRQTTCAAQLCPRLRSSEEIASTRGRLPAPSSRSVASLRITPAFSYTNPTLGSPGKGPGQGETHEYRTTSIP